MARQKKETKEKDVMQELEDVFIATISKELGENIYGGNEVELKIDRMRMNFPSLDYAFGGGAPRGKIIEVFGQESAGKSTFAFTVIRRDQETNPNSRTLYIDVENVLDFGYMFDPEKLNLDRTRVRIVQPDDLKKACQIFGKAAASGIYSVIVFDSTAAKAKEEDVETDYTGNDKGQSPEARIISQCLSKSVGDLNEHGTIAILCSQVRATMNLYGPKEVTTGGNAPKFYSATRIQLNKKDQIKDSEDQAIANLTKLKFVKNKFGNPYREIELKLEYGTGFNQAYDIGQFAEHLGIIKKSGAWYSLDGDNIAQGAADLQLRISQDDELRERLLGEIYAQLGYA